MSQPSVIDFAHSYVYYEYPDPHIWVRIQLECHCQVVELATGRADDYVLSSRTQTGLRTRPEPDHHLDPGYDFWLIFSHTHTFTRRGHASSYKNNPTKNSISRFRDAGWHLAHATADPLRTAADVRAALRDWRPIVARSDFPSRDGTHACRIEYPVKWADGNLDRDDFRVETGPVILLDPDRVRPGADPQFDDFQWSYLDYHDFDSVRAFVEQPTSLLTGATYQSGGATPYGPASPALTPDQVRRIEERLFTGWDPPIPADNLRRLFQRHHFSAVQYRDVQTELYALAPADR